MNRVKWFGPAIAIAILAASSPGQQPNEAEQKFRQLEEKLLKADRLEIACEGSITGKVNGTFSASLAMGTGNKVRLEIKGKREDSAFTQLTISDGKSIQTLLDGAPGKSRGTPEKYEWLLRASVIRAGVFFGNLHVESGNQAPIEMSHFQLGKPEKVDGQEAILLEYKIKPPAPGAEFLVHLWLDSKTLLPFKRNVTVYFDGDKHHQVTEKHTKIKLDKADPKQFELPK